MDCYKQLFFGITLAPETYQKIVRDVLRGCDGVVNIADDIIVHGSDIREHDQRLKHVLKKLHESGLTLNGKKCKYRMEQLTFFGHQLTSDGVNPSPEKVEVVRNA